MITERDVTAKKMLAKAKQLGYDKNDKFDEAYTNYIDTDNVSDLFQYRMELETLIAGFGLVGEKNFEVKKLFNLTIRDKCVTLDKTCGVDSQKLCEKKVENILQSKDLTNVDVYNQVIGEIKTLGDGVDRLKREYESRKSHLLGQLSVGKSKKETQTLQKKSCKELEALLALKRISVSSAQ